MKCNRLLLADCDVQEVSSLAQGLSDPNLPCHIRSHIANWQRTGKFSELHRYGKYFIIGFRYFLERNHYEQIIGWQQFYALICAFFCSIFRVRKAPEIIALNFTYKEKQGKAGNIYRRFMKKCLDARYMTYLHVLSYAYADKIAREFSFPKERILVTGFGINDPWEEYAKLSPPAGHVSGDYALAIGRSNRDYDFLICTWSGIEMPLIIISDTYPGKADSSNITILRNIAGEASYPWIVHCALMILPIDDGSICSGDTVLLNAMAAERKIVITSPSTLAEMYITDGINGLTTPKDPEIFRRTVKKALYAPEYDAIGQRARECFLKSFSRKAMGLQLKSLINGQSNRSSHM